MTRPTLARSLAQLGRFNSIAAGSKTLAQRRRRRVCACRDGINRERNCHIMHRQRATLCISTDRGRPVRPNAPRPSRRMLTRAGQANSWRGAYLKESRLASLSIPLGEVESRENRAISILSLPPFPFDFGPPRYFARAARTHTHTARVELFTYARRLVAGEMASCWKIFIFSGIHSRGDAEK